ncbi:MAG: BrnT family toxin [Rhodanobacteraceae bacterium]
MHTYLGAMEYDPAKSTANARKHGVSFEEAATALLDPHALAQEDDAAAGEARWVLLDLSAAGRLLTVVYTLRGDNMRLISARKTTVKEERSYAKRI